MPRWAVFGLAALILAAIWFGLSQLVITRIVAEEESKRLFAFHLRAGTIALAAESVSRLNSQNGLIELARQPGIAWIAVTNDSGEILQDSSPGIAGARLYSPREISRLAPGPELQGRFLPDDENIYETWQRFRPERLWRRHHGTDARIIFVALDAGAFHKEIAASWRRSWLVAGALLGFLLIACLASFLAKRYFFTRKRLLGTEAFARRILNDYPWAILALDKVGNALFANASANALFGEREHNIHSLPGPDWGMLLAVNGSEIQERETGLEIHGVKEPVSIAVTALHGAPTPESTYLVTIRELAETRRMQRKLEEAQRLAELGKIASGLAHEIRNPLGSICGYAEYLKGRVADDAVATATADLLAEEAGRLNNVLSDLLQLARKPRLNLEKVELSMPLGRAFAIALTDAKARDVGLEVELGDAGGRLVNMDSERIVQVVLNLLLNAIQACQPGQKAILAADVLAPGSPEIPAELGRNRSCLRIAVSDTGAGMDAALQEQIFTPYFTTRPEGSGLGLALSRQIVEAHGGLITVASRAGAGSTFSVFLPQEGE